MLVTCGDGTTSEGEWHESVNFASIHNLPIVFLCENNEFAISVPQSKQMHVKDVARYLLDALRDRPPVLRFDCDCPQDQHVQRALHQVVRPAHI